MNIRLTFAFLITTTLCLPVRSQIISRDDNRTLYENLNRQIHSIHSDIGSGQLQVLPTKVQEVRAKLHTLVSERVVGVLGGNTYSAAIRHVPEAISNLQGAFQFWSGQTNVPLAEEIHIGGERAMAVAYIILEGGEDIPDTRPYLEFYSNSSGQWRLSAAAPTENDFRGHTFYVEQIQSGMPNETWYVVWGTIIGDSAARLRAELVSYDGSAVRLLWKHNDLVRGVINVRSDTVTLSYDEQYAPLGTPARINETLHVTANGLQ